MRTRSMIPHFGVRLAALCLSFSISALAAGIPEPGLLMFGVISNAAVGNVRLTTGTLTWTITTASGAPVATVTARLMDLGGQYSYGLRVPFESVVGSSTLSSNTLQLNSASTTYVRTNVFLTVNGTNYPATISASPQYNFTFGKSDRGRTEEVDLSIVAPGVGLLRMNPSFGSAQRLLNGQFQLSVKGTLGQNYTLLASSDFLTWTPVTVFVCTNVSTTIDDPSATNFPHRFYRIGP